MNKLIFLILLAPTLCLAQVGIGTNSPVTTLQVVGNPTSVAAADGIIAPLLTAEQLRSKNNKYTNSQKGTIVYVTESPTVVVAESEKTGYVKNPGYYYFDGNQWRSMSYNSNLINEKKWFYSPSVLLPTNSLGVSNDSTNDVSYNNSTSEFRIDLYNTYKKQMELTGNVSGPTRTSVKSNTSSSLNIYDKTDLDYFVLYFDNTVFDPSSISIDTSGVLKYKILQTAVVTEKTFMNIVFKEK